MRLVKVFEKYFLIFKFNDFDEYSFSIVEKSYGRDEIWIYIVKEIFDDFVDYFFEWKGMKLVGVCIGFWSKMGVLFNVEDVMICYFISLVKLLLKRFFEVVWWYWYIENKLYWMLDVVF